MKHIGEKSGFDTAAFKTLFDAEEKSFWFTNRNKLILYYLKKYFIDMNEFLEIGCGTGFVLKAIQDEFPESNVTGSELFAEGLEYARKRVPMANLIQLDAVNMKICEQYDVFGAFDVLEHIKEDEMVLKNLYLSLKNSGGGIITVPQHMFMWSISDDLACHVRRYTQKELRQKLVNAGFKVVKITGFVSLLFPAMLVSRLVRGKQSIDKVKQIDKTSKSNHDELHLPRWLNAFFSFVMKIEIAFLKLGISFPFGGSIIAVVKK